MASTGNRTVNPVSHGSHAKTSVQSFSIESIISSKSSPTETERRKAFTSVELRRAGGGPLWPRTTQLWTRGHPHPHPHPHLHPSNTFAYPRTFPAGLLPKSIHSSCPLGARRFSEVQARHHPSLQAPLRLPLSSFPPMATHPWPTYRTTMYPAAGKAEAFTNWIMSRPDVCLSPMLPVSSDPYLLSFRKPKRIRTAFSPHQLMELEQAFEKNHYLVGQERKDLANSLNLSETQVKVWFQNRRTKHKRVVPDHEQQTSSAIASPLATISTEEEVEEEEEEEEGAEKGEEDEEKGRAKEEDKRVSSDTSRCIPSGCSRESTDDEFVDVDTFVNN